MTQAKNLRNVAPELKRALMDAASAGGATISDVVTGVLAIEYGGSYPALPRQRDRKASATSDTVRLELPVSLCERLWHASRAHKLTESSLIQVHLSEHFEIPYTPVRRSGGPKKKEAA